MKSKIICSIKATFFFFKYLEGSNNMGVQNNRCCQTLYLPLFLLQWSMGIHIFIHLCTHTHTHRHTDTHMHAEVIWFLKSLKKKKHQWVKSPSLLWASPYDVWRRQPRATLVGLGSEQGWHVGLAEKLSGTDNAIRTPRSSLCYSPPSLPSDKSCPVPSSLRPPPGAGNVSSFLRTHSPSLPASASFGLQVALTSQFMT